MLDSHYVRNQSSIEHPTKRIFREYFDENI